MAARIRRVAKPVAALVAALLGIAAAHGASRSPIAPTLYVTYSLNCTFTITDDAGKPVTSIAPGGYAVEVTTPSDFAGVDLAGITDFTACKGSVQFQLTGPGVSLQTTLDDGDSDYALLGATFQKSATFVAQDDNQPSVARVVFTTLATGTPVAPSSSSYTTTTATPGSGPAAATAKTAAPRGTLLGTLTAAGKVTLTSKGRRVTSLRSGRYTIKVTDRSAGRGFVLQQAHGAARSVSGVGYVGTRSVTIDLKAGRWLFYAAPDGKKASFTVT
jgi:hypothetical protein